MYPLNIGTRRDPCPIWYVVNVVSVYQTVFSLYRLTEYNEGQAMVLFQRRGHTSLLSPL